jgi:hypothetical protein
MKMLVHGAAIVPRGPHITTMTMTIGKMLSRISQQRKKTGTIKAAETKMKREIPLWSSGPSDEGRSQ